MGEEQKALVAEWDGVFAVETTDWGEVKEVTHDIDAGNNPRFPGMYPLH